MSKRLDVTAQQIAAICKGAKRAGYIAEIKIGNAFIRLVPEELSEGLHEPPMSHLDKLFARKRATDEAKARIKQNIDNLSNDISASPLNKREKDTLKQLSKRGVGVLVFWRDIKNCGVNTHDQLAARKFIKLKFQEKYPDRIHGYILTEAGMAAWKKIENS